MRTHLVVALFVATAAGCVSQHPTLAGWCFSHSGAAVSVQDDTLTCPPVIYQRTPIRVGLGPQSSTENAEVLVDAYREWARELPELLATRPFATCADVDICVEFRGDLDTEDGGLATIEERTDGPFCSATVSTRNLHSAQVIAAMHELGHCLGLAHDWDAGSVMFPDLQLDEQGFTRFPPPVIRDNDIAAIRSLYRD